MTLFVFSHSRQDSIIDTTVAHGSSLRCHYTLPLTAPCYRLLSLLSCCNHPAIPLCHCWMPHPRKQLAKMQPKCLLPFLIGAHVVLGHPRPECVGARTLPCLDVRVWSCCTERATIGNYRQPPNTYGNVHVPADIRRITVTSTLMGSNNWKTMLHYPRHKTKHPYRMPRNVQRTWREKSWCQCNSPSSECW